MSAHSGVHAARLAALPVFAPLGEDARAQIAASVDEVELPTGAQVGTDGDFAYEFFVIEEGTAEVRKDGRVLAVLNPGDFFGEIGLLVTGRRTASVVATSNLRLIVMFDQPFRRLEHRFPEFAEQLREAIRQRLPNR